MSGYLRSLLSTAPDMRAEYAPIRDHEAGDVPPVEVRHRGFGTWICFWALGAGILLPWNALICTFPYLTSLFPQGWSLRINLPSYLGTVYCFANLFFLGLAQRNVGKSAPTDRLRWSFYVLLGTAAIMTFPLLGVVFPKLSEAESSLLFPLLLVVAFLLSFGCAYLQSAAFALAALWGSDELIAVMSGQGGIAVLVSGAQLILAVLDSSRVSTPETEVSSPVAAEGLWALGAAGVVACLVALNYLTQHPEYDKALASVAHRVDEPVGRKSVMKGVFKRNFKLEFAVAFVFMVTLSIFPPITTSITSVSNPVPRLLQPAIFVAFHFFVFNVGDYLGRTYVPALKPAMSLSTRKIVFLSLARLVFVPLFLLCNTPSRAAAHKGAIPDFFYFVLLFAFGMTGGAVSCICMIYASSPHLNPAITEDEKDLASTLASFCLVSGLAVGSLLSFGVNYALNGSVMGG